VNAQAERLQESRMREIRTSGLKRGSSGSRKMKAALYSIKFFWFLFFLDLSRLHPHVIVVKHLFQGFIFRGGFFMSARGLADLQYSLIFSYKVLLCERDTFLFFVLSHLFSVSCILTPENSFIFKGVSS